MNKNKNIESLYNQLHANGSKSKAVKAIANACNVKFGSVKSNWLLPCEFPEEHQDNIISILQKLVFEQNKNIAEIQVKTEAEGR